MGKKNEMKAIGESNVVECEVERKKKTGEKKKNI